VPRGCNAPTAGGSDTGDTRDRSAASRRFARTSAGSGMPFVDMRTSRLWINSLLDRKDAIPGA